ncbi:hypothetical protein BIY24_14145 [Halobacteriovorax marinus]|uniref:hypothetical protein n=1 Tax=Halobacteriovorax marinus TaxID=97084 RepID=UPI000BC2EF54|nr:hypothetical protein [Halobacteriovorax marinus]ATH09045.1 hypothetical protein BIY24_14145 [Halobacteriovorax marinus]
MKKLNNSGFSMVQIMMAAGMMGLLSLGVMKIMENQRKSANAIKSSAQAHSFYLEAKAYMARPGYCKKNFNGLKVGEGDEFVLEDILKSNGKTLYKKGQILNQSLRLTSISTANYEKDTEFSALMDLRFKLDKIGNSYGAKGYTRILKLNLTLDKDGAIKDCTTFGVSSGAAFDGTPAANNIQEGLKDLHSGKKSAESEKVKSFLEKNAALKEMNKNIKTMNEMNKKMEEMFKD